MNNTIEFESFFDNSGIDKIIESLEKELSYYDNREIDELHDIYEVDMAESLTLITNSLYNIKKMSSVKKSEVLGSQIVSLSDLITAHQALLTSYTKIKDKERRNNLSQILHSINVIYPLFVIGLVYQEYKQNNQENKV